MSDYLKNIIQTVLDGEMEATVQGVQAALDAGLYPGELLNDALISAMADVGKMFEEGVCFVPEMLIASRAMKAGLNLLKPHLVSSGI